MFIEGILCVGSAYFEMLKLCSLISSCFFCNLLSIINVNCKDNMGSLRYCNRQSYLRSFLFELRTPLFLCLMNSGKSVVLN